MADDTRGRVWFGGLPTDVDVKKIEEAVEVEVGHLVAYERLEEILGLTRHEGRFRSVVGAWRSKLRRERNILTRGNGDGVLVCDQGQRVDLVDDKTARALRAVRSAHVDAARTERVDLSTAEARRLDHAQSLTGSMLTHAKRLAAEQKAALGPKSAEE
jgi:hypothetical protein